MEYAFKNHIFKWKSHPISCNDPVSTGSTEENRDQITYKG